MNIVADHCSHSLPVELRKLATASLSWTRLLRRQALAGSKAYLEVLDQQSRPPTPSTRPPTTCLNLRMLLHAFLPCAPARLDCTLCSSTTRLLLVPRHDLTTPCASARLNDTLCFGTILLYFVLRHEPIKLCATARSNYTLCPGTIQLHLVLRHDLMNWWLWVLI